MASDVRLDPLAIELSDQKKWELIDKFAKEAMDRGLDTEAIFTLELTKPVSWIALQFILAFSPVVIPLVNEQRFYEYAKLFQERKNNEIIIQRIEQLREERESIKNKKNNILTKISQRIMNIRSKKSLRVEKNG